jgi:hypothetical protein
MARISSRGHVLGVLGLEVVSSGGNGEGALLIKWHYRTLKKGGRFLKRVFVQKGVFTRTKKTLLHDVTGK